MKLSSRQDIEASAGQVFLLLTDFGLWERTAVTRGADVMRVDSLRQPGPGMEWRIHFPWRARRREVTLRLTRMEAPAHLAMQFESAMFHGTTAIDIFEMSTKRCRIHVVAEIKPQTLPARLMLQSLRLARQKVERRFDHRIAALANEIESRLKHAV